MIDKITIDLIPVKDTKSFRIVFTNSIVQKHLVLNNSLLPNISNTDSDVISCVLGIDAVKILIKQCRESSEDTNIVKDSDVYLIMHPFKDKDKDCILFSISNTIQYDNIKFGFITSPKTCGLFIDYLDEALNNDFKVESFSIIYRV